MPFVPFKHGCGNDLLKVFIHRDMSDIRMICPKCNEMVSLSEHLALIRASIKSGDKPAKIIDNPIDAENMR